MAARSTAAEPVLDLFAPSHVGIVAADIDAAMRELGDAWQTSWKPGGDGSVGIRYRGVRGIKVVRFRSTWGERGPLRVELIQAVRGTIWPPRENLYFHHLGYGARDLVSETRRLSGLGLEVVWTRADGGAEVNVFAYLRLAGGILIELVAIDLD